MISARHWRTWGVLVALNLSVLLPAAFSRPKEDPLNQQEINELRDAAQDPDERLKLFVKFARARLDAIQQAQAEKNAAERAQHTHDRLQDFVDVYDELDDNIDTFLERKADLRHVLRTVIEADTEFQARLRAVKDSANATPSEAGRYEFLLRDALDAVDKGVEDHRQLLNQQEEAAKHKKK